jgi:triosephosphate isomerase (TIM)
VRAVARPSLIVGNWKMNGLAATGAALARAIAQGAAALPHRAELVVCPPATLLATVRDAIAGSAVGLGGQDCHAKASGAFTGDVSAEMLADAGCRFAIVGHSERRSLHGESDAIVRAKAEAAHRAGLVAILCIGETLAERESGRTLEVLTRQLAGSVPVGASAENTVVAYEPVWAIGTGKVAVPDQVAEAHAAIRAHLAGQVADGASLRLLYGGSVKPENAAELLGVKDVDGALVGGASLDVAQFLAIAAASTPR